MNHYVKFDKKVDKMN